LPGFGADKRQDATMATVRPPAGDGEHVLHRFKNGLSTTRSALAHRIDEVAA
jgi:hypothetical protein